MQVWHIHSILPDVNTFALVKQTFLKYVEELLQYLSPMERDFCTVRLRKFHINNIEVFWTYIVLPLFWFQHCTQSHSQLYIFFIHP
jgi:hypothetical protein